VSKYISVPEVAAVIKELAESEAARNLPTIRFLSGIREEQNYDVSQGWKITAGAIRRRERE
jgi:hypothetical protein